MDKLDCIQANLVGRKIERDELSSGLQEAPVELGAEPLEGSGFENEVPEPAFAEQEVS